MRRVLLVIPLKSLGLVNIPIFSYGFMIMLAFICAIFLALRQAERDGLEANSIYDISLITIISGLIGARLAWLLLFSPPGTMSSLKSMVAVWNGGLVYYGGLLLALLTGSIYIWRKKIPLGLTVDCFAPGMAAGIALGRLGCFLNGCCYGAICQPESWFAVVFPPYSPAAFQHRFSTGQLSLPSLPVYPAQIFASIAGVVILIIILSLFRYRKFPGQMILFFLQFYAVARFMLEFIRDDTLPFFATENFPGLKAGQIVALFTFIVASVTMFMLLKKMKPQGNKIGTNS